MKNYYKLQIGFPASVETYNSISTLLATNPAEKDFASFPESIPHTWTYEIIENENDPYFDFINNFLDILENKYDKLADLGVEKSDISIWLFYEYDQQCNMEFNPQRLKRLGENGINFCITCWESGEEYNMTEKQE